ncbi:hypothetical protein VISP3789_00305 [Vibrio splendidus ATCC 33789]|nr:hypothetical protein VISP3789_00305 [Vibrio splendidus ATCC 33789]
MLMIVACLMLKIIVFALITVGIFIGIQHGDEIVRLISEVEEIFLSVVKGLEG